MSDISGKCDASSAATCRQCGKALFNSTTLCAECAVKLARSILLRDDRDHAVDIVLAVLAFFATNGLLITITGTDVFSMPAMLLRTPVLGIPSALLLWKWYRLMQEIDPDYGSLWCIYWQSQFVTWMGLIILYVVAAILVIFVMIIMSIV